MKTIDDGGRNKKPRLPEPVRKVLDKFRSMDPAGRDKLVTRGLMAIVAVAVIGYAAATMLPKDVPATPDGPGTQDPAPSAVLPGLADPNFTGATGSQAPVEYPGDEPEYAIEPSGTDSSGYSPTGGKTMYAIGTDGKKKFEIRIPLGYGTFNSAGGTYVKPVEMDVTADGNEPLYFIWASPSRYDMLLERGGVDYLDGYESEERYEDCFKAIDYYIAKDIDGNDMAVILARRSVKYKPEAEFAMDDLEEYYIIADCGESLPFMGRISGYALDSGLSRRYPTLNAIARAMIAPASEPGFPEHWTNAEGMTARADDPKYGDGETDPVASDPVEPEPAESDPAGQEPENGT